MNKKMRKEKKRIEGRGRRIGKVEKKNDRVEDDHKGRKEERRREEKRRKGEGQYL